MDRKPMTSCGYCLGAPRSKDPIDSHSRCPGRDCECFNTGHHPTPEIRESQRLFGHFPTLESVIERDPGFPQDTPPPDTRKRRRPASNQRSAAASNKEQTAMSDAVNLRALPGSLIATLPDGVEKHSFAGDWGSLKWKVHNWALDNHVGVKPSEYNVVRDRLRELGANPGTKPTTITIADRRGRKIVFVFTPEASPRKTTKRPAKKAAPAKPVKKQPARVAAVRASRRTVKAKATKAA